MNFTGERYVPQLRGQIYYEHFHRYAIAAEMVPGMDVLDIACGEGYGAALLATKARSVIGVDIDEGSIRHAAARYPAMNLSFRTGSARQVPLADESIDIIVSFETIEHLVEQEQMMHEFLRVLRPDGRLLISSPNRLVYSDERDFSNPYHLRELYFHEFRDLLRSFFSEVELYGQRIFGACAIYPIGVNASRTRWLNPSLSSEGGLPGLPGAEYYIAVCSRASGVELPCLATVYLDLGDDLLSYLRTTGLTSSDTAMHLIGAPSRFGAFDGQRALEPGAPVAGFLSTAAPADQFAAVPVGDVADRERSERERVEGIYRSLEVEHRRVNDELDHVRGRYRDQEREIAAIQQERSRVEQAYAALEGGYAKLEARRAGVEAQLATLEVEHRRVKDELDSVRDRYGDQEREIAAMHQERSRVDQAYAALEGGYAKLEARCAEIEAQLATAVAELELQPTREAKLKAAVAERDAGRRQIELLRSALDSTEASLGITKRALDNAHMLDASNRAMATEYQRRLEQLEANQVGVVGGLGQSEHTRQLALTLGRMDLMLGTASDVIRTHGRALDEMRAIFLGFNETVDKSPQRARRTLDAVRSVMRRAGVSTTKKAETRT